MTEKTVPTTISLDDLDGEQELSRPQFIDRHMASMRYVRQVDPLSKRFVEYAKVYSDPNGTHALATAIVRKDDAGIGPDQLEGFVISVSMHVRAVAEDVEKRAWKFIQPDLLRLIEVMGGADETRTHVITSECTRCKKTSIEFVSLGKEKLCPECFKAETV